MITLWLICFTWLSAAQAETITVWHAYRGEERATLERLLQEYSDHTPGITVESRAVPHDTYANKLEAAIPRDHGPDLFIAAHEKLGVWSTLGLIRPLTDSIDGLPPAISHAAFWEGAFQGYPLTFKTLALFYNRDLVPDPPADTNTLLKLAREQRSQGRIGLAYPATDAYFHGTWQHGFNGRFLEDHTFRLDRAGNTASIAFVQKLMDEKLIPEETTTALVTQLFNDGRAAMSINGPWFLGEINPDINFGVVPMPIVNETGAVAAPFMTVELAMVSARSAHPEQAERIAAWLFAEPQAIRRAIEGRQSVATMSAYAHPEIASDPILSAFRTQMESAWPMPSHPKFSAVWEPMARALRRVMRGAASPEEALIAGQQELEIIMRPPPAEANPTPFIVVICLAVVGLLVWSGRSIIRARTEIKAQSYAYGWVAPATLAMGLLVIVPFVVGATVSLFAHRDGEWTFVGLAHFIDILFARDWPLDSALSFWFTLAVTVLWTAANVALHAGIGVALAMLLRAPWLQLRGIYRVLLILPWAVPNYITALIWKGMFHKQFGAINALLDMLGLETVNWFSSFATAFTANLVTNTWLGFPFMMVVTLGALQAIPSDLEEAASIDGASGIQRFWHVTWPLLKPALLPAIILGSIWTFNMFNIIYLVSAGEPDGGTEILISEAYRWAFTRGHRYGYAAAYAVLIFGVLVFYSKATDRLLSRKAA
jgi:arabinogalactan oligomer/maltooligosaccharide transport system permease protein